MYLDDEEVWSCRSSQVGLTSYLGQSLERVLRDWLYVAKTNRCTCIHKYKLENKKVPEVHKQQVKLIVLCWNFTLCSMVIQI